MDRQLKQTALPCRLGGEHIWGHYSPIGDQCPLPDVDRRVGVRVGGVSARHAEEGGLIGPVLLRDMSAGRALARCVAGINEADGNASAAGFVNDKPSKLSEAPIAQSCALVATSGRYPRPDAVLSTMDK